MCVPAGKDYAAIDDSGDDRGELTRGDRNHHLVQQPQPLVRVPISDQHVALFMSGKRKQIRVAETLADRGRLGSGRGGRLEIAACLVSEYGRHEQVTALDAFAVFPFEQPLGAREPAARLTHLSLLS